MSDYLEQRCTTLLAALLFFAAPTTYIAVEHYAARGHIPKYSYLENLTSDLGVSWPYNDSTTGQAIYSPRANAMNLNFALNGFLYLGGHVCLLRCTAPQTHGRLWVARLVTAVLYNIGAVLVATNPAAEKLEHDDGFAIVHIFGAVSTLAGGNLNCILAGLATSKTSHPIYRFVSLFAGIAGFASLPLFMVFGNTLTIHGKVLRGFWQRCSMYPSLCWEYATTFALLAELVWPILKAKHA